MFSHRALGADLAPALELGELLDAQPVVVARGLDQARLLELGDLLLAQPVDVHRPARDVVLEQLPAALGALAVGALGEDLALDLDRLGLAERAALGRARDPRALLVLDHVGRGREDLRDDVAGAQHDDVLAGAQVLADDVLLVVQRRQLDRHAADVDGLELGERVHVAELADVPLHAVEARDRRGGRELPGDGPARIAPDDAEPALQLDVVDLDHDAVDLEVELAAALLPGAAAGHDLVLGGQPRDVVVDAEAVALQPLQRVPVAGEGDAVGDADAVGPHGQRALGHELRVELADGPGGRVARVHEGREAPLGAALVERGEVGQRHVDLAADLEQRRDVVAVDAQRDRRDRAQVVGHVLADLAVAARGAGLEHAVAIDERDGQTVDLGLGDVLELGVLDALAREVVAHAVDPRAQLLLAARVGQREHRLAVGDLGQRRDRLAADALGGRVGRQQLGVLGLDGAQLVEQLVVLVVGDARVVEHVVAATVLGELLAQLRGAGDDVLRSAHCTSRAAGASSRARSYLVSASMPERSVRSKCTGVTAMWPAWTAARSVPGSSWKPGSAP